MKTILCAYDYCAERNTHWMDEEIGKIGPHRSIEVTDEYLGVSFCSITCACMAGYYSVTKGWLRNPKDGAYFSENLNFTDKYNLMK